MYNFKNTLTNIKNNPTSKYIIIGVIVFIAACIIGYVYIKYLTPKLQEIYKPNKEKVPKFSTGSSSSTTNVAELYLFKADWCPHCKSAQPEWDASKKAYDNQVVNGYKVIYREINCTKPTGEVEALMDKFNIDGYPTLKLLKDDQIINFDAKVTTDNIKQFLNTAL
jgi:thiol-disulfide isomerase/thioredoxin